MSIIEYNLTTPITHTITTTNIEQTLNQNLSARVSTKLANAINYLTNAFKSLTDRTITQTNPHSDNIPSPNVDTFQLVSSFLPVADISNLSTVSQTTRTSLPVPPKIDFFKDDPFHIRDRTLAIVEYDPEGHINKDSNSSDTGIKNGSKLFSGNSTIKRRLLKLNPMQQQELITHGKVMIGRRPVLKKIPQPSSFSFNNDREDFFESHSTASEVTYKQQVEGRGGALNEFYLEWCPKMAVDHSAFVSERE